jgi:olefin beta-lactone synthetase
MRTRPAGTPPPLDGLDPAWSLLVRTADPDGIARTWHVLDNAGTLDGTRPAGTLLCVHGNPTWSYMWRHLIARAGRADPPWRVVAPDHLDMGFSERTGKVRRLQQRIADLSAVTDVLGLDGPVVTVGHDWGGVISLGWALANRERLAAVVLGNTAVHRPEGAAIPPIMQFARVPGLRSAATVATPTFLWATMAIAHPWLPRAVRGAYVMPYNRPAWRRGVGGFVRDIPLKPQHPSWLAVSRIAEGLGALADVPTLLLWGPRDPVFQEVYLRDLRNRLPHADVHRFAGAGHLLAEDADLAGALLAWLAGSASGGPAATGTAQHPSAVTVKSQAPKTAITSPVTDAAERSHQPVWFVLDERAADRDPVIIEPARPGRPARTVSWALLARQVRDIAAGLSASGVRAGDRVALLVPPGPDLAAAVYACLRIGAVIVVADAGLGVGGLHRAVRGAGPRYIVAIDRGLAAAKALRWPGTRIAAGPAGPLRRLLGARLTLEEVARRGAGRPLPPSPCPDDEAGVVFTSGSTGPAKGVVYTHRQMEAGRQVVAAAYDLRRGGRLVAAFAPFALFGPALGVTSVVPNMDVTAPATLTAAALADAVAAAALVPGEGPIGVFASPAALANVARTASAMNEQQRRALRRVGLLLSAGAPVPASLLIRMTEVMPAAIPHTPYGMTEVLPVTDVTLAEILQAGTGDGVLVGRPLPGVEVAISPLDHTGAATGDIAAKPGVTGEIAVRAAHVKERYDQLWLTEHATSHPAGWHRTGDVGHLDADGRLWVEGRLGHVLVTADGVVTPVGIEQSIQNVPGVARAALVGVGPVGTQQAVAVVETAPPSLRHTGPARLRGGLAPPEITGAVRRAAGVNLAAVLVVAALPTDVRHNAKIDRPRLAHWAAHVLAGGRGRGGGAP